MKATEQGERFVIYIYHCSRTAPVYTPIGNIGPVINPVGKSFNMALNQQYVETDR